MADDDDQEMPDQHQALPQASIQAQLQQQAILEQMELRRRARTMVVPTDDAQVRQMLRGMGKPITLFGEGKPERRDRLRHLLATMDDDDLDDFVAGPAVEMEPERPDRSELFYTEGSPALRAARMQIAHFSLLRAAARLGQAKRRQQNPDEDVAAERRLAHEACRSLSNLSSELGDERPLATCAFRPDGSQLAVGSWSGLVKLWVMPDCAQPSAFRAHDDRITGLAWHPASGRGLPDGAAHLATGGADSCAKLWTADGQELAKLEGHTERLGRVAFHPGGQLLGTASFDCTWRLWDLETQECLVEQEGHSRSVYAVAFQGDGALAASAGLDAIGRVWDLRLGRSIATLQGHVKGVLALDWAPNGYLLASGSEDHTCRIWDLRTRKCVYTLPCHQSLVSQVQFEPEDGHYLLTAGYDKTAKVWSATDYKLLRTLAGHESRIMGADICPDGTNVIATVGYDRTLKTWSPEV